MSRTPFVTQPVAIARALTQEPRVLLADEPVASLDPVRAEALRGAFLDTAGLDDARATLYVGLPVRPDWAWHVTGVRYGRNHDLATLRLQAAELQLDTVWHLDTIAYLELRGNCYETVAAWNVGE